jgi:hypothetical protein
VEDQATDRARRITIQELENALLESKVYRQKFHAERRERNTGFIERIKVAKTAIKANNCIKVDNSIKADKVGDPDFVRSASAVVSAGSSASSSTAVSALIETRLKETHAILTSGNAARRIQPIRAKSWPRKRDPGLIRPVLRKFKLLA